MQQRIIIKFLVAERVASAEIHRRLSAVFKRDTLSRSTVQECLNSALAFAAVVNVSVTLFVLERRERQ